MVCTFSTNTAIRGLAPLEGLPGLEIASCVDLLHPLARVKRLVPLQRFSLSLIEFGHFERSELGTSERLTAALVRKLVRGCEYRELIQR